MCILEIKPCNAQSSTCSSASIALIKISVLTNLSAKPANSCRIVSCDAILGSRNSFISMTLKVIFRKNVANRKTAEAKPKTGHPQASKEQMQPN